MIEFTLERRSLSLAAMQRLGQSGVSAVLHPKGTAGERKPKRLREVIPGRTMRSPLSSRIFAAVAAHA
jgi:hypothetical protein